MAGMPEVAEASRRLHAYIEYIADSACFFRHTEGLHSRRPCACCEAQDLLMLEARPSHQLSLRWII